MKFLGIIPARWDSSRYPGKPLAEICGLTMIERVYRQVSMAIDDVVVATDDTRIFDEVVRFGGRAVMTPQGLGSGTLRVAEAYRCLDCNADVIINVQGDEPFVEPQQIRALMSAFADPDVNLATLARRFDPDEGWDALFDPNSPKVVIDARGNAIYFSRSIIPYVRGRQWQEWIHSAEFFMHIGMYGYRASTLTAIASLPVADIAKTELLEQLTWVHAGLPIKIVLTQHKTIGVDTPEDLARAIEFCKNNA